MSVEAMSWVFKNSPYTLGTRLVHLALADVANDDHHWLVWASQSAIAKKAKVSIPTVSAALKQMVADGYLERVSSDSRGQVTYRFLRPGTAPIASSATHKESEGSNARPPKSTPRVVTTNPNGETEELKRADARTESSKSSSGRVGPAAGRLYDAGFGRRRGAA